MYFYLKTFCNKDIVGMFKVSKLGVESILPFMRGSCHIPGVEVGVEY